MGRKQTVRALMYVKGGKRTLAADAGQFTAIQEEASAINYRDIVP